MTRFSIHRDRKEAWKRLLKMSSFSEIQLNVEIAGGINKFQISSGVMKDLIVGMFSAKQYLGNETNETLQRMRDNFFEILKNTIWFRDFERCILKNLNCFWRYYMNLDVPDYWFYSGPSTNSIEALEKIRRFLMKKLQVNETNLYNL